jgi:hypothetical protein
MEAGMLQASWGEEVVHQVSKVPATLPWFFSLSPTTLCGPLSGATGGTTMPLPVPE